MVSPVTQDTRSLAGRYWFLVVVCLLFGSVAAAVAVGAEAVRPTLQLIDGSRQAVDVFWLKSAGELVGQGEIAAGAERRIATTIRHRFALVGRKGGAETDVTSQVPVQAFHVRGMPDFYTQRVDSHGFPLVGSARASPFALREADHIVNLMLANRPDVREAVIRRGARLCVMAWNEFTTDLPEFAWLTGRGQKEFCGLAGRDG